MVGGVVVSLSLMSSQYSRKKLGTYPSPLACDFRAISSRASRAGQFGLKNSWLFSSVIFVRKFSRPIWPENRAYSCAGPRLVWKSKARAFFFPYARLLWEQETSPPLDFTLSSSNTMKYVLVTGGVLSGIGKGIIASSTGMILKAMGYRVTSIKIDPYP
jgi:hypothetical protein